ncbi:MAG: DUF4974 domain-containing protein [Prevotella sp.]|nr:DUF4974 domain-containing protein [Prevotella sp.]
MKNEKQIRMLLHPEQYSDEQLDQMLDESHIPVPDVDEEWQQFKARRHGHNRRRTHQPVRWAAILVIVAALSGITYAAIHHLRQAREEKKAAVENQQKPMVQKEAATADVPALTPTVEERDTIRQDQQFNNVELQQIMQQLSLDYGVKVVFKNEATRTLRFYLKWEANDSIQDILNRINHFEKVHLTLSDATITIE